MKGKKILHISSLLLFQDSFADIYQLCLCQIAQFVTDAEFAKSKVNLIDKSPGLLSSFSTFQMFKKEKLDPPPRKAHLGVELGEYGYSLLQFL